MKEGNNYSLFLNGNLVGTATSTTGMFTNTTTPWTIGQGSNNTYIYNGYISDVRITKNIARYNATMLPTSIVPTAPLFNQNNVDYYWDSTTFLLDGTSLASDARGLTISNNGATNSGIEKLFDDYTIYLNGTSNSFKVTGAVSQFGVGTGDFTLNFWIKTPTTQTDKFICGFRTAGSTSGLHVMTGGASGSAAGTLRVSNGTTNIAVSTSRIDNGLWNHCTVVRKSGTLYVIVNGVVEASGASTETLQPASDRPCFGTNDYYATPTNGYLNAYLSNIRFTKGARTITSLSIPTNKYSNYASGPTIDLWGKYTSTLMNFEKPNGSLTFTNEITGVNFGSVNPSNLMTISNSVVKNGSGSLWVPTGQYALTNNAGLMNFGTGDFTVETWLYLTNKNTSYLEILGDGGASNKFTIRFGDSGYSNKFQVICGTDPGNLYNGMSLTKTDFLNKWRHIAVTRKDGTLYIFVDGVLLQTGSNTANLTSLNTYIGAINGSSYAPGAYYDGLRITRKARYLSNFIPPNYPLPLNT